MRHKSRSFAVFVLHLALFAALGPSPIAIAETLIISGMPQLTATLGEKDCHIAGTYRMKNTGDSPALRAFPVLTVGGWSWSGSPSTLEPGKENSWEVNENIPLRKLMCATKEQCAEFGQTGKAQDPLYPDRELYPDRGLFPVLAALHYEDFQARKWESAQVHELFIGALSEDDRARLSTTPLRASLEVAPMEAPMVSAALTIKNKGETAIASRVLYYFPKGFSETPQPRVLTLAPALETKDVVEKVRFARDIEGFRLPIFALLEWNDGGLRNFQAVPTWANIPRRGEDSLSALQVILSIVFFGLVYIGARGYCLKVDPRIEDDPALEEQRR